MSYSDTYSDTYTGMDMISSSIAYMNDSSPSATLSISPPAGYASGNILILAAIGGSQTFGTSYPTTPSGWTPISSTGQILGIYYKIATASEPTYTITYSTVSVAAAMVVAYPSSFIASSLFQSSGSGVHTFTPGLFPAGVTGSETVLLFVANIVSSGGTNLGSDGGSALGAETMNMPSVTWTTEVPPFGPGLTTSDVPGVGYYIPNIGMCDVVGSTSSPAITTAIPSNFYTAYIILSPSSNSVVLVQAVTGIETIDYGLSNIPFFSTSGNMLVVLAAWSGAYLSYNYGGNSPAVNVTDSAGNLWRQVGITSPGYAPIRCAIWVALNALPVTWVSVSVTGYVFTTSYVVAEFSGTVPAATSIDYVSIANTVSTTVNISSTATTSDISFALLASNNGVGGLSLSSGLNGYSPIPTAAFVYQYQATIFPFYLSPQTGTVSTSSWSVSSSSPLAAVIVGLKLNATAPTQYNPNFPRVVVEAAFGAVAGDFTRSVDYTWSFEGISWTDLSNRAISHEGDNTISMSRGRQYELSQPEAGEISIQMSNLDGAFTPSNPGSPYYSNALNQNMSFQSGIAPWTANNGTTIVQSSTFAYASAPYASATNSMRVTPNGVTASPGAKSELIPLNLNLNDVYSASVWLYVPAGWAGGAQIQISWFQSNGSFISTSSSSTYTVPTAQWFEISQINIAPPANAAYATIIPQLAGTPASSVVFYVAEAALAQGSVAVLTGLVAINTPVRVTAWWQGRQYPLAFGYVERWPQEWPEMPQWGFSTLVAADAISITGSTNLPSAVGGEIRKDSPYAYFPCSEQYSFQTQSLTPIKTPIDANGLIAINYAPNNQRVAVYVDGGFENVTAGQALNLLGSEDTALGCSTYTNTETGVPGPSLLYSDPNLPTNKSGSNGFSIEFWFIWGQGAGFSCTLLSVFGPPSSYIGGNSNGGIISVGINTGVSAGLWINQTLQTTPSYFLTDTGPQHFVMTVSPGPSVVTTCYLNGVVLSPGIILPAFPQLKAIILGPGQYSYDPGSQVIYEGFNFVAGQLAIYPYVLSEQVVQGHAVTGSSGYVGVVAPYRFAQILTWGRLGLKRGGTRWFTPTSNGEVFAENTLIGEAYSYSGTSAQDAIQQLTDTEGGRVFVQGNGSLCYVLRWATYSQTSTAAFGDNPAIGQIPFEKETGFGFDNSFINNDIVATQTRGPVQYITVNGENFPSISSYFNRSSLTYSSYAENPEDVLDRVNWSLSKFQQPYIRVDTVIVDAAKTAANPGITANIFATILSDLMVKTVTVSRTPVGGAAISTFGTIDRIAHEIGPGSWKVTYQVTRTFPENQSLILDVSGQDSIGTQNLGW